MRTQTHTCPARQSDGYSNDLTVSPVTSICLSLSLSLSPSLYNSPAPFPFITVRISLLAIQSSRCHHWHLSSYFFQEYFPCSPLHHYERCDSVLNNRCVFRQGREGRSLDLQPLSLPRLYLCASPFLANSPLPSR